MPLFDASIVTTRWDKPMGWRESQRMSEVDPASTPESRAWHSLHMTSSATQHPHIGWKRQLAKGQRQMQQPPSQRTQLRQPRRRPAQRG